MYLPQLLGVLLFIAIYLAGTHLAAALQSAIPGSIYGLLCCTVAMLALPGPAARLRPGAVLLLTLVPLFLVPITVRMAVRIDFTDAATWRAMLVLSFATLLGAAVTGLIARLLLRGDTAR